MEKIRGPWAGPFWDGVEQNQVLFQRCDDCKAAFFPPQRFCAHCSSESITWEKSQGEGVIYSFTTVFKGGPPELAGDAPYTVAIINMDEGYRISSRLIGKPNDGWQCDERVKVKFDSLPTGSRFPFFVAKE